MKKILSLVLSIVIAITLFNGVTASAATLVDSGSCGTNANWTLYSDGVLVIDGKGDMRDYGYYFTTPNLPPWYDYYDNINEVIIKDGVTSVGEQAFNDCTSLKKVTLSDTVETIGTCAFAGSGLTSVTISKGVTFITSNAFNGCNDMTTMTVDSENSVYYGAGNCIIETETKTLVSGCKNTVIPEGVVIIGSDAFRNCKALEYITMPDTVRIILSDAFENCSKLGAIRLSENLEKISYRAFNNCYALDRIALPDGLLYLSFNALQNCGIYSITIPSTVLDIGESLFSGCKNLTKVTVAEGNEKYHSEDNCIIETATNTLIAGCRTSRIPDTVETIGYEAFYGIDGMKFISIPKSVTCISYDAFDDCYDLTDVYYDGTEEEWNQIEIFEPNHFLEYVTLHFGDDIEISGEVLKSGTCGDNATWYITDEQILYIGGFGDMYDYSETCPAPWYAERYKIKSVVVTDNVTSIGDFAFVESGITDVTIGTGVEKIGMAAFSLSAITSITIPDNVKIIDNNVFMDCYNLRWADIGNGLTEISYGAFNNCDVLEDVWFGNAVEIIGPRSFSFCDSLTDIDIPESVNYIGTAAFSHTPIKVIIIPEGVDCLSPSLFDGCESLKRVTIPKSVRYIEYGAFGDTPALKNIYYSGTVEEWNEIRIYDDNEYLNSATIHYAGGINISGTIVEFGDCDDDIEWYLYSDGTLYISGSGDMPDYKSGDEAPWYEHRYDIKNAAVSDNITFIGNFAFYRCTGLEYVWIPGSVTAIGKNAFDDCVSLMGIYYGGNREEWQEVEVHCDYTAVVHYASGPVVLGGTITSFGDPSKEVTVELLNRDREVIKSQTFTGNKNEFFFENVTDETAHIRIYKSKHTTIDNYMYIRNYDMTRLEYELCLYGDVNADGNINGQDILQMSREIANLKSVFTAMDYIRFYKLDVADITGDGIVNSGDILQIYRKIANMPSLFDTLE